MSLVHITNENWKTEVLESNIPVLVDFWAEWCGPCRAIAPVLDELSSEYEGKLKIAKVNVDECPELAGQFGIRSIPTLLIFKDGTIKDQMIGALPKDALKQKIDQNL